MLQMGLRVSLAKNGGIIVQELTTLLLYCYGKKASETITQRLYCAPLSTKPVIKLPLPEAACFD
jgi:hypothetical protein